MCAQQYCSFSRWVVNLASSIVSCRRYIHIWHLALYFYYCSFTRWVVNLASSIVSCQRYIHIWHLALYFNGGKHDDDNVDGNDDDDDGYDDDIMTMVNISWFSSYESFQAPSKISIHSERKYAKYIRLRKEKSEKIKKARIARARKQIKQENDLIVIKSFSCLKTKRSPRSEYLL